jgi:hypothetical protein
LRRHLEVGQLQAPIQVDLKVFKLEVALENVNRVQVAEQLQDLPRKVKNQAQRQATKGTKSEETAQLAVLSHCEADFLLLAIDLHRDSLPHCIVQFYYIWVLHMRQKRGFTEKSFILLGMKELHCPNFI